MRSIRVLAASFLILTTAAPTRADGLAAAQSAWVRLTLSTPAELVDPATGSRLQALPAGARISAWLRHAESEALVLELSDGRLARLERSALGRAQVGRQPRPGHVRRAVLTGVAAGLAVTAIGFATCNDSGYYFISCEQMALVAAGITSIAGAGIGLIVGHATSGTRWREIDDLRPRASGERPRFTPGVALSLRF